MTDFPSLYTPRLTLRPLVPADAPRISELAGDARIAATTAAIPHPYHLSDAEKWIDSLAADAQTGTAYCFAITLAGTRTPGRENDLHDTGHLVGSITVREIYPVHRRAVLGYWIGVPYWNKGFATEAGRAILQFAFARKNLNRISADHYASNPASGRVMQKIGFTYEGLLRQHHLKNGVYEDVVKYGILQEDWIAARKTARLHPPAALQTV